ncbi:MAG: hypothetical protein HYV96_20110 [Opitutae bacterium]|nr:hypothetical protein [Opitutae bacterium]
MKNTLLALCAAVALVVSFSACSSQMPVGLGIELVSLDAGAGKATVRYLNPSVVAYNVEHSSHRVFLDGKLAGTIEIKAPLGIPQQRNLEQSGTFVAGKGAGVPAGSASYRLESTLTLVLYGDNLQTSKLSGSGTVVLK